MRQYRQGVDEEIYVRIFNECFGDYDDIRSITVQEAVKMEESPRFDAKGFFIAEWDGQPAGMVHAYVDKLREEPKGFIQSLAVLPSFRRRGIATRLVKDALSNLKQRGMQVAEAWAQSDREGCVHLYESKFGFKVARVTSMMKGSLRTVPSGVGENKTICLRDMDPKDAKEIALLNKLDNEAFKEHFNYRPTTVEETKYMLLETPWFKKQHAWFATLRNEPIGYVVAGIDTGLNEEKSLKYGWILDIGVLKPQRRFGIGTFLMLHAMQWLKSLGMEDALLYVDDLNVTGAFRLYEKVGFKRARRNLIYQLPIA
jgi:mycothiol synthase